LNYVGFSVDMSHYYAWDLIYVFYSVLLVVWVPIKSVYLELLNVGRHIGHEGVVVMFVSSQQSCYPSALEEVNRS